MSNKQTIEIDLELYERLLSAASDARSMLDDVHCYDTDVYEELGEVLNLLRK